MDAPVPSAAAAAVHAATLVLDSHIDIPWPPETGGPFSADTRRAVDLPKLRRGGVAAGCFAAFVPQGPRDAAGIAAAWQRAQAMLDVIEAMGSGGGGSGGGGSGATRLATTAAAIEAAWQARVPAIVPCLENGHPIGDDLGRLAALRARGCIYVTLTHNGHNLLADSAVARPDLGDAATLHEGLSPLGRRAVAEMNRVGLMIDVAHLSRAGMMQAAACSRTPIVSTHSCARALCDHPRNLDDAQLDALAQTGGVIQITALAAFVRAGGKPETTSLSDMLDHIDYAVSRIGIGHVGIGSDFDGGGGLVGWRHAGESEAVTAGLLARGYDPQAMGLLWGGNFLRVLRAVEAAAAA